MTLAQDFESGAAEILKQFGKPLTLRSITAGVYDPVTNSTTNVTKDYSCRGYIGAYQDRLVNNVSILKSDRKCTLQAKGLSVSPLVGWQISAKDGIFYSILDVVRKEVDDVTAVWVCQIRHGG